LPIGILYIGVGIVVQLLLVRVFRMILNKGTLDIPQKYLGSLIYFSYLCSMKTLSPQMRKYCRDKRFTLVFDDSWSKRVYNFRITNIRSPYGPRGGYPVYGKESQRWCPVEINIVIDGTYTFKHERYDNTTRTLREHYNLDWDPRRPRREIRQDILGSLDKGGYYGREQLGTSNELELFLKCISLDHRELTIKNIRFA